MSISFLGAGAVQTNNTAGTSCAPSIPGLATNLTTRLYMGVSVNGDRTLTLNTPAGWTKLGATALSTSITIAVYAKWFATGDSAPSVTWTTASKNTGVIVGYNGLDLTNPEDVGYATTNGTSTSQTSPSITALTMGAARLHICARQGSAAATAYDFRTKMRSDTFTTATTPAALTVSDELGMAIGALGTRIDTIASVAWVGVSLFLRPAVPDALGLVQSAKQTTSGTSVTATFPATTTAGNCLTAEYTGSVINTPTIPNFLAPQAQQDDNGQATIKQFYRANAPATTTVVATRGSGTDNNSLIIKEWAGLDAASPLDTQGTGQGTVSGSTYTVTSGTSTTGSRVAIATFTHEGSGGSSTFDANYNKRWDQPTTTISPLFSEDIPFAGGATKSAVFTTSAAATVAGQIMILKAQEVPAVPQLPFQTDQTNYRM